MTKLNSLLNYVIYPYLFTLRAFLRSIFKIPWADNYKLTLKFKILFLEFIFLFKATFYLILGKNRETEKFFNYVIIFPSYLEFACLFFEIFGSQEYKFTSKIDNPQIIDCGCNWGMASLYFKFLYPQAQITAIDANSAILDYFRQNIALNNLTTITLINGFLSDNEKPQNFYINNKTGWSVANTGDSEFGNVLNYKKIIIPSIKLSKIITSNIQLLKIDIEGFETQVIKESFRKLNQVGEIYIEYHRYMNKKQNNIASLINLLRKTKFNITTDSNKNIVSAVNSKKPLIIFRAYSTQWGQKQ